MQLCTKKVVMALVMVGVLVQSANAAETVRHARYLADCQTGVFPGTSILITDSYIQKNMIAMYQRLLGQGTRRPAASAVSVPAAAPSHVVPASPAAR